MGDGYSKMTLQQKKDDQAFRLEQEQNVGLTSSMTFSSEKP